ncbi:MAG: hypothetical protein NVS4B10_09850 [Myxococcales bacterium]
MTRPAGGAPGPEGAVRRARESDAEAIARIYNQGIEDRVATFETEQRSVEEIRGWFQGAAIRSPSPRRLARSSMP